MRRLMRRRRLTSTEMEAPIRVLMITTGWPDLQAELQEIPTTHFVKRQADFLRAAGVEVDVLAFRGRRSVGNYLRAWLRAPAASLRFRNACPSSSPVAASISTG